MVTERVEFEGHSGSKLAARLEKPDGEPLAVALFAHCFTCSKDIPAARLVSTTLAEIGFAVLRFDFTGLGHSDGEFENTNFTSNVEDLVRAARFLENEGMAPSVLIGHSLGGAAVLMAAGKIASARAVVTIGAPADPAHVAHNFSASLDEIDSRGQAKVSLGGRPFTIKKQFVDDINNSNLTPAISGLRKALLVLHAPLDATVGIENAARIFGAAKHPKSFVTLDDANHLITRREDAEYAANVIAAWARKYVARGTSPEDESVAEGVVRVSEVDPKGFRQHVKTGEGHWLISDEPVSYGGTNRGPTPYGLLSAGLGACTSMTIRLYARRKGWNLNAVAVDVSHEKTHATDCEDCESSTAKIDHFSRSIVLEGDLTEEQKARLLEIADKCPVHRTLKVVSMISTSLADT